MAVNQWREEEEIREKEAKTKKDERKEQGILCAKKKLMVTEQVI